MNADLTQDDVALVIGRQVLARAGLEKRVAQLESQLAALGAPPGADIRPASARRQDRTGEARSQCATSTEESVS